MLIKKIPINQINPAPYNPRTDLHPQDPEYTKLLNAIKEFSLVEPLIWNERTGNLVGGHQRLKIIKNELGMTEVDVSVVNLDDAQEKALNIALNKISGHWDLPKLKEILVSLDDGMFDISLAGFDQDELKSMIDYEGISSEPMSSGGKIVTCPHCEGEFRMKRGKVVPLRGPSAERVQEAVA